MHSLIDPLTFSRIKDLPLVAKTIAQGFLHGFHNSAQRGTGVEFSQYRVYEPGDPLSRVDWKLFARSDRYFVREAERESDINVHLVLDASASMLMQSRQPKKSQANAGADSITKLDYGRYLLASIAYLAHQQGDAVGLMGISGKQVDFLPALNTQQHWQKLLLQLARITSGDAFPDIEVMINHIASVRQQGIVIVVSDFYERQQELTDFMQQLVSPRTDVIAVQLETHDEVEFSYTGQVRFEDRETGEHKLVNANQVKSDYLHARETFNHTLANQLQGQRIQLLRTTIEQPLDKVLYNFLLARSKAGRP